MPSWLAQILNCCVQFTDDPREANCISHTGNFHADDVFCHVFFGKSLDKAVIFRSLQELPEESMRNPNAYIYDIGYGALDHHQKEGNGKHPYPDSELKHIPYASFGLVWKTYGPGFCDRIAKAYGNMALSSFLWKWMEENLVIGIDASDNGVYPRTDYSSEPYRILTVSNTLTMFSPTPSEEQDYEAPLYKAISMASLFFDNILYHGIHAFEHSNSNETISLKFHAHEIFTEVFLSKFSSNEISEKMKEVSEDTEILYHPPKFPGSFAEKAPIPTSTFGVSWEKYGKEYSKNFSDSQTFSDYIWKYVRNELVIAVDAYANGIKPLTDDEYVPYKVNTVSDFINSLNPLDDSKESYELAKKSALMWAEAILERTLAKALDRIQTQEYVEKQIELSSAHPESAGHILFLDKYVHWQEWVANSPNPKAKKLWFVIFPSNKGIYNIQPVPCRYNENGYRKGFPKKWWGCNVQELREITNVKSATFIHKEGFIGGAENLKGAILLAKRSFCNTECKRIVRY